MLKDIKNDEALPIEMQEVMKHLVSALRIVKIYPSNNPIYSQALKKSFETLFHYLSATAPDYHISVQKTNFMYRNIPFGKDAQMNRPIAMDLFTKGMREIVFSAGIAEQDLEEFLQATALSPEELSMRSGISTILWEKGVANIKIVESGLDEVIETSVIGGDASGGSAKQKDGKQSLAGKTLMLSDVKTDPEGFASGMLAFAMRTRREDETVEERLFTLCKQAGLKIVKDHAGESNELFTGLAKSLLALESPYRQGLIAGKLYQNADAEAASELNTGYDQLFPNMLHEVRSGHFSHAWTAEHVAVLLKKTVSNAPAPSAPPPVPGTLTATPITPDLAETARSLEQESDEEIEALKAVSNAGMESDIIEAATRTLMFLIPLVNDPRRKEISRKDIRLFSGVVQQLEDMLSYLLKKNNYELATIIIEALHMPVAPEFKPRMTEALKKTVTTTIIKEAISEMRKHPPGSQAHHSAYTYLASLDRKATEALLELLAEETDREARLYLLDLLKNFGKNQTALLGERLADDRWYVVRNIVSILGESKTDHAIAMLRKAADHKNVKIRQEVLKGVISFGGRKAVGLLARFLRDPDPGIQVAAAHGFAELPGTTPEDAKPLLEFMKELRLKKKDQELTLAAIKTLGKIGGWEAAESLKGYTRIRWWKPRNLQRELKEAALRSIAEIARRDTHGR